MCFSATASFTAAGVLSILGLFSLVQVRDKSTLMVASTPLLFGFQQACEGVLWLTINDPGNFFWASIAARAFLLFALIIWPLWVPGSLLLCETNQTHKKTLRRCLLLGLCVALYSAYMLLFQGLTWHVYECSIAYDYSSGWRIADIVHGLLYVVAVSVPFFVSSMPLTRLFGVALVICLFGAAWIKYMTFASVWCFCAALLSGLIVMSMRMYNRGSRES